MASLSRETLLNIFLTIGMLALPFVAAAIDEPFYITLATRVAILGLAGVGLNLALGTGGLVSFGHAAFFGLGGYAAGILASHALNYTPIMESPFLIEGTNQMLIIWLVAIIVSGDLTHAPTKVVRFPFISWATIWAKVVFPNPGPPDRRKC